MMEWDRAVKLGLMLTLQKAADPSGGSQLTLPPYQVPVYRRNVYEFMACLYVWVPAGRSPDQLLSDAEVCRGSDLLKHTRPVEQPVSHVACFALAPSTNNVEARIESPTTVASRLRCLREVMDFNVIQTCGGRKPRGKPLGWLCPSAQVNRRLVFEVPVVAG